MAVRLSLVRTGSYRRCIVLVVAGGLVARGFRWLGALCLSSFDLSSAEVAALSTKSYNSEGPPIISYSS